MRPSKGVQGLDGGCLISEFGPGLALFTFCCAWLDKRPLWREGRPAQQGLAEGLLNSHRRLL